MAEEDFNIETLAEYLHLDAPQVFRLAERGKLPGRRLGGNWRFSRAEIHHWLEAKIGISDETELVRMEGALERATAAGDDQSLSIAELLPVEAIAIPLGAKTRNSVVTAITELAGCTGLLWDTARMADGVRQREEMYPTALDNGVALLHPRRPLSGILGQSFLALGITESGIPFGGNRLTDIFFLICSQGDQAHLRILARLSRLIHCGDFVAELRSCGGSSAAHDLFLAREQQLLGAA